MGILYQSTYYSYEIICTPTPTYAPIHPPIHPHVMPMRTAISVERALPRTSILQTHEIYSPPPYVPHAPHILHVYTTPPPPPPTYMHRTPPDHRTCPRTPPPPPHTHLPHSPPPRRQPSRSLRTAQKPSREVYHCAPPIDIIHRLGPVNSTSSLVKTYLSLFSAHFNDTGGPPASSPPPPPGSAPKLHPCCALVAVPGPCMPLNPTA